MRKISPLLAVIPAVIALACGSSPKAATATAPPVLPEAPPPPVPPPAPTLRLGDDVVPLRYALDLTIIPGDDGFRGVVEIDVEVKRPIGGLWLHGTGLTVSEATLATGNETLAATPLPQTKSHLGFRFARLVAPGPARLRIAFSGTQELKDSHGLFKQKDGDDWYSFTSFETTDANKAFPCFDDPRWKTPWQIGLHVKREHLALTNSPQSGETPEDNGLKLVRFAESKPLPTYLVAFAVGPFGVVDGGKTKSGAPVRIITPRGREREATYAAEVTASIVDLFEEYFASPYPFEKLDSITLPFTVGFSAMENPGLITYVQTSILARPEEDTLQRRRRYVGIAAHEIAHIWFGDLVTLSWWDDTWLNESFANWAGSKIVEKLQPTWGEDIERIRDHGRALRMDTLESTRAVRQPILSEDDIENAFDQISYAKGQAVLDMFEVWLGPDTFRKGIQDYLRAHAYGSATANDFFAAIGAAAGQDVAPVMTTFVDQAGAPLVTAALACPTGGKPKVTLSQERYVVPGAPAGERRWRIPVCVRPAGGEKVCTVLAEPTAELELPGPCPAFVYPNAGGAGYYRSAFAGDLGARVIAGAGKLTLPERVALLGDLSALSRAAKMPTGDVLAALPRFAPSQNRHLAETAVEFLEHVRGHMVGPEDAPAFARYVGKLFGKRARALGFVGRAGESEDDRLLRQEIVDFTTVVGRDAKLRAQAHRLAAAWLRDHKAVPPDSVALVLGTAAATSSPGDRSLLDPLIAIVRTAPEPAEKERAMRALGFFEDPALLTEVLALLLDERVDFRLSSSIMRGLYQSDVPSVRQAAYRFFKEHGPALIARMPDPARTGLLRTGAFVCDDATLKDYEATYAERARTTPGGPRIYAQNVERAHACIALRQAQRPSAAKYLKSL